jgi:glycine/D-amino acid oxidase-like deaminating enzyme
MIYDAVIVGAGSAGLSCAHRLQDAGADFRIVSDTLGGRIAYDPEQRVNFGAYFVMANYRHASRLVRRGTWINPFSCRFHDGHGGSYATVSGHTLAESPELARFAVMMAGFMRHYARYKKNCESMSQREAMEADPYIGRLFRQPAEEFIGEHRLGKVAEDYISEFSYACTGVALDSITALDFCNVSQGLVLPIHRFSFDADGERARLGGHLVEDTVTGHAEDGGVHEVTCAGGRKIQARNIVFATPAVVTAKFLGLGEIRGTCQLYVDHVRGRLRLGLDGEQMNLFPSSSPVIFTARQDDGSYLVYSRVPAIDLGELFTEHELIGRREWEKAMYVSGRAYVEQQYGPSTYVAGDHNGLGLEPAAISGSYAARQILAKLPR